MRKREIKTTDSVWIVKPHWNNEKKLGRDDYLFYCNKARKVFKFYKTEAAAKRAMKRNQNYFHDVELYAYEQFWLIF